MSKRGWLAVWTVVLISAVLLDRWVASADINRRKERTYPPPSVVNYDIHLTDEQLLELVGRKTNKRRSGLTKTCRMVLIQAGRPLSAREVCNQIMSQSPPLLLSHKDPMASVNTLLSRLAEYGEARVATDETGRRTWQWVSTPEPPLAQTADIH